MQKTLKLLICLLLVSHSSFDLVFDENTICHIHKFNSCTYICDKFVVEVFFA